MSDTLITIVAIALAAILMFVFPLMTLSDRADDSTQLVVDSATSDLVNTIRTTGKLTQEQYGKFIEDISSTGIAYNVDVEIQQRDETVGKKRTQVTASAAADANDAYVTKYMSQIEDELYDSGAVVLKEGDIVKVRVQSNSTTISQQLKNFLYSVTGNDTYAIAAEHAGIVNTTGSK